MANPIRKAANKIGLDLHRYRPEADRLAWISGLNIKTVFDVGANIGQFAEEIRERLPEAQIYSFEPIKECFEKLTADFKDDKNFQAYNFALGEMKDTATMNKSSYTPSSSLLTMADSHKRLFPHTKDNHPESVKIKRLDDIFDELKPKKDILIKVDTQGYESKVIAGGRRAFGAAKAVIIEASFIPLYEGQPLFADIYKALSEMGFIYRGSLHQKTSKTGEILFEDSIYVRA